MSERWDRMKDAANRGDYNLQFLLLVFGVLPGVLWMLAEWIESHP